MLRSFSQRTNGSFSSSSQYNVPRRGGAQRGAGRSLWMGIGSWPVFLKTSHCVGITGKLMDCGWDVQEKSRMMSRAPPLYHSKKRASLSAG